MKNALKTIAMAMATAVATWALGGGWNEPSPALLPQGRSAVVPVHHLHKSIQPNCSTCHPRSESSRWASDRLTPDMELCGACHAAAAGVRSNSPVGTECRSCHKGLKEGERPVRGNYPRPNIRFSHKAHKGIAACRLCHPRASAHLPKGKGPDIIKMQQCFECHRRSEASTECRTCHIVRMDGRIITNIGGTRLVPPSWLLGPNHGVQWAKGHATTAGADSALCGACHQEAFCQGCHAGALRPRNTHPGDWITSHGVSSRLARPPCRRCHKKQSFCLTCHRRSGVAPDSPARSLPPEGAGRYHRGRTDREICRRARFDIIACMSCHSESSCTSCHANTGHKPHPPGFRRKCGAIASRNRRVCAKCHLDEAWQRCK